MAFIEKGPVIAWASSYPPQNNLRAGELSLEEKFDQSLQAFLKELNPEDEELNALRFLPSPKERIQRFLSRLLPEGNIAFNISKLQVDDTNSKFQTIALSFHHHPKFRNLYPRNQLIQLICQIQKGHKDPYLTPLHISLVNGNPEASLHCREFEKSSKGQFQERKFGKGAVNEAIKEHLLTPDFIASLPAFAPDSHRKILEWQNFLTFKENLVKEKTIGLRYLNYEVDSDENTITFRVVAESEEVLRRASASFRNQVIHVFDTSCSSDPFIFNINQSLEDDSNAKNRQVTFPSAAFNNIGQLTNDGTYIISADKKVDKEAYNKSRRQLENELSRFNRNNNKGKKNNDNKATSTTLDVKNACFASLKLELDEDLSNRLNNLNSPTEKEKLVNRILSRLPNQGFLSISLVGDLALIQRHQRAIRNFLSMEKFLAPFLPLYFFDIKKAALPEPGKGVVISDKQWLNTNLNEQQKEAVRKMIDAPQLCLIQGPPGTGKTTVIAEACYQFATQGKKVLLVSQTHTALDNALSRLNNNPHIRALRLASNSNAITDEGQDFVEDKSMARYYQSMRQYAHDKYLKEYLEVIKRTKTLKEWENNDERRDAEQHLENANERLVISRERLAKASKERDALNKQYEQALRNQEHTAKLIEDHRRLDNILKVSFLDKSEAYRQLEYIEAIDFYNSEFRSFLKYHFANLPKHLKDCESFSYKEYKKQRELEPACGFNFLTMNLIALHNAYKALPQAKRILEDLQNNTLSVDSKTQLELNKLEEKKDEVIAKLNDVNTTEDDFPQLMAELKLVNRQIKDLNNQATVNVKALSNLLNYEAFIKLEQAIKETKEKGLNNEDLALQKLKARNYLESYIKEIETMANKVSDHFIFLASKNKEILRELETNNKAPNEGILNNKRQEVKRYDEELKNAQEIVKVAEANLQNLIASSPFPKQKTYQEVQEKVTEQKAKLSTLLERFAPRRDYLMFVNKWHKKLEDSEQAAGADWSEIGQAYKRSINLVALTCNENERTLRENNYNEFDVVIVDEVSKATPLELLQPLMSAKKAILVGDHRQLPPVFTEADGIDREYRADQEEDEENSNANDASSTTVTRDNIDYYEKLVTTSLFKELFEQAPEELRQRLNVQYRMHPTIMNVINNFYEGSLVCGNPDAPREHKIDLSYPPGLNAVVDQNTHVLWVDTTKDTEGKHYDIDVRNRGNVNEVEALEIAKTLMAMNERAADAGYSSTNKLEVGVVSFYQPQCRVIRNKIRELNKGSLFFENLDVDINTVIRYQGKEKAVILISMVKNDGNKGGKEFAPGKAHIARFEFINVAMSRAQQLLIVFGARNMLDKRRIALPRMDQTGVEPRYVYQDIFNLGKYDNQSFVMKETKEYDHVLTRLLNARAKV